MIDPALPPVPMQVLVNPELDVYVQTKGGLRTASSIEALRAHTLAIANMGATIEQFARVLAVLNKNMDAMKEALDELPAVPDDGGSGTGSDRVPDLEGGREGLFRHAEDP